MVDDTDVATLGDTDVVKETAFEEPNIFLTFDVLAEEFPEITRSMWREFATDLGFPVVVQRVTETFGDSSRRKKGLMSHDVDAIVDAYRAQRAGEEIISANKLSLELKVGLSTLLRHAAEHNIVPFIFDFGKGPNGKGFNRVAADTLRGIIVLAKENIAGADIYSLNSIRSEYKISRLSLDRLLESREVVPKEYWFENRVFGFGVDTDQFHAIKPDLDAIVESRAGATDKAVYVWADQLGVSPKVLDELAQGVGVIAQEKKSARGPKGKNLSQSDIDLISEAYTEFNLPENIPVTVTSLTKKPKISPSELEELANGIGIRPYLRLFGKRYGQSYTTGEIEKIVEAYAPFMNEI